MASSLFKRSLALLSAAILAAALVFAAVGMSVLGSAYANASLASLGRAAAALAATFPSDVEAGGEAAAWCARAAAASGTASTGGYRVTLIRSDGKVLADSEADPATMENHASRPEVAQAIAGFAGSARRKSATVGEELLYAAVPLRGMVLRLAVHEPSLDRALAPSRWTLAIAALAFAIAALAAA